jgi:hypothetical protein
MGADTPLLEDREYDTQEPLDNEDAIVKARVWRNRRKIKAYQKKSSYFRFLFFEFKKIGEFGKKTHIFYTKLLPPGLILNKDIAHPFTNYLVTCSCDLFKILTGILQNGWHHLNKREYNLLLILKKLCEKITKTNFNLLNYKDRNLIEKLRSIETLFLILCYHNHYLDTILSSVQTVLEKDPEYHDDIRDVLVLIKRILTRDGDLPSFYNFILGLNMFKSNRYLILQDLIQRNCGEIISSSNFECDQDIKQEIDRYVQECKNELVLIYKQKQKIEHIQSFLPKDDHGAFDFKTLQYLYESGQKDKKHNFFEDQENAVLFTARYLGFFESAFVNLLNGKVSLSGLNKVEIFSHYFFQLEFSRIRSISEKLVKYSFDFPSPFTLDHYRAVNGSNRRATRTEAEAVQMISEGITNLYDIGKKVERVLNLRLPQKDVQEKQAPLEAVILRGKPFSLPYEDRILKYRSNLGGKTVVEALSFVVTVCFLSCVFFRDRNISTLLDKEERINREIQSMLETLERIAPPKVYQELMELYSY